MKADTIFAAALAALVAAPVLAQSVSPGEIQVARSVGVQPGLYSMAQLIQLDQAQHESGASAQQTIDWILANPHGTFAPAVTRSATRGGISQGAEQLARIQEVTPGQYTAAEIELLNQSDSKAADRTFYEAVLTGAIDSNAGDRSEISPGKVQLAASLGVDPADYTSSELAQLLTERRANDPSHD